MEQVRRVIYISFSCILSAISLISSGCASQEPKPLESVVAAPSESVDELATRIESWSKKYFPDGVVLDLGKTYENRYRYATIEVPTQNGSPTLDIAVYMGANPNIESTIRTLLGNEYYSNAKIVLDESGSDKTIFHDVKANGIKATDGDFIGLQGPGHDLTYMVGEEITKRQEEVSKDYRFVLGLVLDAIQKEMENNPKKFTK